MTYVSVNYVIGLSQVAWDLVNSWFTTQIFNMEYVCLAFKGLCGAEWPLYIYLRFYITFNTVHHITQGSFLWAEETSTNSWSRFCAVNCRPLVSNYQLSKIRSGVWTADLRGGRRVCYHCMAFKHICYFNWKIKLASGESHMLFWAGLKPTIWGPRQPSG